MCLKCNSTDHNEIGADQNGNYIYECQKCGYTFYEDGSEVSAEVKLV